MARLPPATLLLGAALAASCGSDGPSTGQDFSGLARVSGPTPFTDGCEGAPQPGIRYRDAEVEPSLAIDPGDPSHLVAAWQQDRWSGGGASGPVTAVSRDGGRTWTRSIAPLSACAGGTAANGGLYERASDPWVTIAPGGVAYEVSVSFDRSGPAAAILVSRSTDGGSTWSAPLTLARDADPDVAVDKETVTADPADPLRVYAVWDRLTGLANPDPTQVTGPAWFARTVDGGATWEPARAIYDPGKDAQTIGSQIVVLPGGALVDVLVVITRASSAAPDEQIAALRSGDAGLSWSAPVPVAALRSVGTVDPKTGKPVRTGGLPSAAVDRATGALYVVWADAGPSGGARDAIVLSASQDGGASWSPPALVSGASSAPAFTPAVAVAASGRVGVAYDDLRDDDPADATRTLARAWLATSGDGGATWREEPLGGPFDLRRAPDSGGAFLGDYQGLTGGRDGFGALVTIANTGDAADPTDVFFAPR